MKVIKICLYLVALLTSSQGAAAFFDCCCYDNDPVCWHGGYISGQIGAGWGRDQAKFTNANYFNTLGPVVLGSKFHANSCKMLGGGALGYNYQSNCVVAGIEAGALNAPLKKNVRSPYFPSSDTISSKLSWLATGKLRLGYAYDSALLFVTGGWAGSYHDIRLTDHDTDISAHSKKWINGWTLGAGADYKVTNCISLGFSYDFLQFNSKAKKLSCSACGSGVGFGSPKVKNHLQVQSVLFRINYHFNL